MTTYTIVAVSELPLVVWPETTGTAETVRRSVDGTLAVLEWWGEMPPSITALTTRQGVYGQDEMLAIMAGPAWTSDDDLPLTP